ncbi:MAG: CHAT domain-containing protein [Nitrospira defluvii]|nr:CHAT domain-containing protein [Nitrospira defluvii]
MVWSLVGVLGCTVTLWVALSTQSLAADTGSPDNTAVSSPDQEMHQGRTRFHQGAFAQAAIHWMEAARLYEQQQKPQQQCQALINLAHALEQGGQIKRAQVTLQTALKLSEQTGNRTLTATILGRLGSAAYALGKGDQATEHLTKALALAREEHKTALVAGLLNDLGNVLASRNQFAEAIDVFAESKNLATQTNQSALAATAQTNAAMALLEDQQFAESERALDAAWTDLQTLQDSYAKSYGLLNVGLAYDDLRSAVSTPKLMAQVERPVADKSRGLSVGAGHGAGAVPPPAAAEPKRKAPDKSQATGSYKPVAGNLLRQASDSFVAAAQVATRLGDARAQSYAWGYLGSLLEKERRYAEALDFTRKASFAAQKVNAPESLYRWQWQTARLLKASGREDEAMGAYQRAVSVLKPIRYEYSVGYQGRHYSFRDSVAPLFTEVEDTLLRRAAAASSPEQSQQWLVQVRDTVEASRAAELQDYFRDDCVATARARGGGSLLPANTAVVYPIMLQDRLELLVNTTGGLRRYGVPVDANKLTQEVRTFRRLVQDRRSQNYLSSAQALYGWLMAPLQQDFLASGITTVVMVPDGPLRTIPIAALHDGHQFVVDKYAVAVTPSMDLTDPRPLDRGKINLLSMGLTESVQGFPALPNVATEVQAIKAIYGGQLLMDNQFLVPSMEREIKEKGIGVVHIASHGVVESDVNNSFLLAYDDKITMDRLSQLVGLLQYRKEPLELLTLSACETAVGDDRAALGLAGIAVKAGARSALASLWFIDDQATSELVAEFYRQLQDSSVTKAVALQRAQQKILAQPGHDHPSFWAPFLLINNWM